MVKLYRYTILVILLSFSYFLKGESSSLPVNLKTDHLENPIGIDNPSPRLTWRIEDNRQGARQSAYRIIVGTDSLKIASGEGGIWDSGKQNSDKQLVTYKGNNLTPFTKYYWKVTVWDTSEKESVSDIQSFETGMMDISNWQGNWISDGRNIHYAAAPYFRKKFETGKEIASARVYIAVAGLYELFINGEKIGNQRLDPMYTRFDRRNLYVTHDVTAQLQKGENAIGVILGNGWYNHQSMAVWDFDRAPWRNRPAFCLDLHITYADGTVETIPTDLTWKKSDSPIIFNSIYTAEHYDTRLEQEGWSNPGFDDSKWQGVALRAAPSRNITAQQSRPIRNVLTIPAKSINKIDEKTYVYDFGQNMSGVTRITVSGEEGTELRIKHGERLYDNGRVDLSNIDVYYRGDKEKDPFQTDILILSGKKEDEFMARFNYKGFRYVEVTSSKPIELDKNNLTAYFMHSDVSPVGKIETSSDLINKLWQATNNAYLSNLMGYPTDCPQREKNGWTGDGHLAIESALYNFDGITVYEKWLADHRDEQQPNGVLPDIIPTGGWGYGTHNGLDWTSTIAIIPWEIYKFYGDSKLLADCYDNIKRYVNYVNRTSPKGLTSWGRGDWVPVKSRSNLELTSSVYFYVDTKILAEAAKLFGKEADHQYYSALAEKIKNAINKKYLDRETGIYANGTQTELSVPLHWKVVPEDMIPKVAQNLAKKVEEAGFHLDVGVLGAKAILNALSENGYPDVAYKVAVQDTYPSWGWWIVNGATTLLENWDLDAERDISDNHMMFGEIGAWFFKGLGGIYPDAAQPGFKHIILRPHFEKNLKQFDARFHSPYGLIQSQWEWKKGKIHYNIVVPVNSSATLHLPGYVKGDKSIKLDAGTHHFTFIPSLGFGKEKASVVPVNLSCEYLTNPVGLDVIRPRFSWILNATDEAAYGQKQTAYRILVSNSASILNKNGGNMWDSGWVESDNMQLIEYGGKLLQSDKKYYWVVSVKDEKGNISDYSKTAEWSTGLFSQEEWAGKWIGTGEEYKPMEGPNKMYDPWFRKTFDLKEKPSKAILFVASVGYHEVYVNGKKIDNHVLAPAATDHTKRARYIAYDIAPALISGKNVIVLWLGTSWSIFGPYATPDKPRTPLVIAQTDIYGTKGQNPIRIATDESWKTHPSPNKLIGNWGFGVGGYGGEIWDAGKEVKGWNLATLDTSQWQNATEYNPAMELSAQQVETNALIDEIHPVSIESRPDGTYRVDMGVNFAGWTQIPVQGNPGDTIRFQFSEREQDDMTFGLMSAYVIGAPGKGTFENRFNYSSGRWITIKGLSSVPKKEDIKGWMVRTAFDDAARFECSDPLQNWIYNTVKWTFENLSLGGFIVDCPQRERFGYGGDAHATSETGLFNYKLGAFYSKWLEDWRDVQGTEPMTGNMNDPEWARKQEGSGRALGGGILPQTAPTYHGGGGPAWGGIVVTLPWFMYQHHGDRRVLEDNFEMIKGWLEFLDTHVENDLLKRYGGRWDFLGDWLWPGATSQGMNNYSDENIFFNNCYWVYNLKTATQIARIIGRTEEADQWARQAERSAKAIHTKYYHPDDHNYSDRTMRSLAAALYGDIMPDELRPKVMERLAKEILVNQNGHIDVGITGGAMLFKVLREEGRDDLIYSMTSQTTYPSWGLMRESGATTIWEMWEKDLPGHSLLHSSYLYPGAWYIDGVAGIRRDPIIPGFRKFEVRVPKLTELQISEAKASFDSPAGLIESSWQRKNGKIQLDVTVPPNCMATILFPDNQGKTVQVNAEHVKETGRKDGYILFEITAGKYRFSD